MSQMIRIISTPPGPGHVRIREPYVGCRFKPLDSDPLAEECLSKYRGHLPWNENTDDELLPPPMHIVPFDEVLRGLREAGQSDWADHLENLTHKPRFIHFPIDCCEVINT